MVRRSAQCTVPPLACRQCWAVKDEFLGGWIPSRLKLQAPNITAMAKFCLDTTVSEETPTVARALLLFTPVHKLR